MNASEEYLHGVVVASSIFCIIVGVLTILGVLHAK